jgi:methylamine dehydrogenase accessory protein MauD
VREAALDAERYVLSRELGLDYQVPRLPYAVLIDGAGTVRARGLVNTREHLESLFEARHQGVASVQEYLGRDAADRRVA